MTARGRRTRTERAVYDRTRLHRWTAGAALGPTAVLQSLLCKGWLETYSGMGHSWWRRCQGAV